MDIVLKRIMAYIIDVLLILILMSLIVGQRFINPYIDEYTENYTEFMELQEQAQNGEIETDNEEFENKIIELNYNINKYKVISSSISLVATFAYFGILQWALKGQTVGKKIMKIRVVANNDDKKLNIGNFMLRSIILNNTIFSIIFIVGIYIFDARGYYNMMSIVNYLQLLVTTIIVLMVVLRKDFRGLHDFAAGTKVIDLAPAMVNEPVKEDTSKKVVIEAKEVEEQETEKKETKKKSNTKKTAKRKSDSKKTKSKEKE